MNILITGGAGFIGFHLARYHAERGDTVHLMDNLFKTEGARDADLDALLQKPNVRMHFVDMTQPLSAEIDGALDIVYHLAAINGTRLFYEIPYDVARTNVLATIHLLDWLRGRTVGRILYTSTSEVYAGCEALGLLTIPTPETVPVAFEQPTPTRFSYGTSKFMGEFLCMQFGRTNDIPATVIRYHNIYGPRMGQKHVIPEFILRAARHENPFAIFGGDETRAFCHVDDAVAATHRVATTPECVQEIVHIGNMREEITIGRLAETILSLMGIDATLEEQG
ncbi:MAG TPA: SDR family oxidoreductase, partial [Thermoanaerobaculia bacterium]|nr:SDR family oxidoreductase [Thermoanaerobaculia bacterium]